MCLGAQPFLTNKNVFSAGVMAVSSKLAIARIQTSMNCCSKLLPKHLCIPISLLLCLMPSTPWGA